MGYFLGVDLGTTYSAAATRRDGHTEVAALSDRSSMVPSVLFLGDDDAILVGEAANRRGVTEPERVAREFKRRFGDSTPLLLGGAPYGADILTARLLRWVVERVTEREGEAPERVAVTHPANWGDYKLDLLRQAVRHADLDVRADCATVSEPHAAATWYATHERVEPGQVVAVYDLGGGTFDAAVLRRTDDGFTLQGSPEGVERLGGIDFDAAVVGHVTGVLGSAWDDLDPEDPTTRAAVARLRHECVDAKEALSSDTQVTIPVVLPGVHTEVRLTRTEFESMIRPALAETVAVLRRALRGAGVGPDDVTRVLLVGGSSRIPLVGEVVGAALGRPTAVDAHPKNAVAMGAAVAAAAAVGAADPTLTGVVPVGAGVTGTDEPAPDAVPSADGSGVQSPTATEPAPRPAVGGRGPDPRPPVIVPAPPRAGAPTARHAPVSGTPGSSPRARPSGGRAGGPPGPRTAPPRRRRGPAGGRRDSRRLAAIVLVTVLVLAVAGLAGALALRASDRGSPGDGTTTTVSADATTTSDVPPEVDADGDGMIDEPGAPPGHVDPPPATVAPEVASLNHGVHEGFERVSIRFTGDLPPTAELHPDANRGLLRVWFPEVSPPGAVDDAAVERFFDGSELGLSAFLVIDRDGQAFVDIHADRPVTAQHFRVVTANGEPVIAVDVRAADGPWTPSTVSVSGVLLDPPAGGNLTSTGPVLVEGYARRGDDRGVVEMYDAGGTVVASHEVSLPGGGDANGYFSTELQPGAALAAGSYEIRLTGAAIDGGPPAMVQTTVTVG